MYSQADRSLSSDLAQKAFKSTQTALAELFFQSFFIEVHLLKLLLQMRATHNVVVNHAQ